jgi:hypothetical protein
MFHRRLRRSKNVPSPHNQNKRVEPWRCNVSFSEQPPSKQWAALKFRGETLAEVWFKPEGEPFVLTLRIPQETFQLPGLAKQLTVETLLKAVAVVPEEVESWYHGDTSHDGNSGANPDFKNPLPPPPPHLPYLDVLVRLNPPPEVVAPLTPIVSPEATGAAEGESSEPEFSPAQWQELEVRWKAILSLEATVDGWRSSMEGLFTEMDNSLRRTLTIEEKSHALRADVTQWEQAKSRVRFALPKMKDFIHRAIWALGSPERKQLGEIYKEHIQPHLPFPRMTEQLKHLEDLRKDRQVLSEQGKTVYHECKGISANIQGALRTLQNNAVNAQRKKNSPGSKGRFLK